MHDFSVTGSNPEDFNRFLSHTVRITHPMFLLFLNNFRSICKNHKVRIFVVFFSSSEQDRAGDTFFNQFLFKK